MVRAGQGRRRAPWKVNTGRCKASLRQLLRTVVVAVASSATTALLFAACVVQQSNQSVSSTPAAAPGSPSARVANVSGSPSATGSGGLQIATARAQDSQQAAPPSGPNPAVSVYQQNGGSVVNITSLAVVSGLGFGGQPTQQQAQPQGIGSGFFIDTDGRIVTNNHVVQDADQLAVTLQDKTTVSAELLGRDSENDLAVIKVDPNSTDSDGRAIADRIKPISMGDSDQVTIGETAIAIGSPLGL